MDVGIIIGAAFSCVVGVVLFCIGLYLCISKKIIGINLFGQSNICQDKTKPYAVGLGWGFITISLGFLITAISNLLSGTNFGWISVGPTILIGCIQIWSVRKKYNSKLLP